MFELTLVSMATRLQQGVIRLALKSLNRRSIANIKLFQKREQQVEDTSAFLEKFAIKMEDDYQRADERITKAYHEISSY